MKIDANKQLQLADYFAPPNANWLWRRDLDVNTTPVVFDYQGRKFLVGTSKECRLWLLDRDALGGEDHRTTLHTTPLICNDARRSTPRASGARWRVAGRERHAVGAGAVLGTGQQGVQGADRVRPADRGGVAAFKLEQTHGKWQLTPAWLSRDMDLAEEDGHRQRRRLRLCRGRGCDADRAGQRVERAGRPGTTAAASSSGPARRIPDSRRAALYALDGQTGKELWSSGKQIESWNHFSGLTVANGRAYLATFDGTCTASA